MLTLGKTYEDVMNGNATCWISEKAITCDDIFFCRKQFDILMKQERITVSKKTLSKDDEGQLLSRKAIKQIYDKKTNKAWQHYFDDEENNGLLECRSKRKDGNCILYVEEKLHRWIIRKGLYTPEQLSKMTGKSQPPLSGVGHLVQTFPQSFD